MHVTQYHGDGCTHNQKIRNKLEQLHTQHHHVCVQFKIVNSANPNPNPD